MHSFIANELKLLIDTIIVRTISYPTFSMELILAFVVFIVQCLLYVEIEASILRSLTRTDHKRKTKNFVEGVPFQISDPEYHRISQIFQKNREMLSRINYDPLRKPGMHNNHMSDLLGFSKGNPNFVNKYFSDREKRAEFLLSITPSQYIRKDREATNQKEFRTCVESLTENLQKALIDDPIEIQSVVKEAVKHSLNTLKDNIVSVQNSNHQLANFPTPSFQNLMDQIEDKKALEKSLSPDLISSIYVAPNVRSSINNSIGSGINKNKSEIDFRERKGSNLSIKSSKSLNDISENQDNISKKIKELMVN